MEMRLPSLVGIFHSVPEWGSQKKPSLISAPVLRTNITNNTPVK